MASPPGRMHDASRGSAFMPPPHNRGGTASRLSRYGLHFAIGVVRGPGPSLHADGPSDSERSTFRPAGNWQNARTEPKLEILSMGSTFLRLRNFRTFAETIVFLTFNIRTFVSTFLAHN